MSNPKIIDESDDLLYWLKGYTSSLKKLTKEELNQIKTKIGLYEGLHVNKNISPSGYNPKMLTNPRIIFDERE